MAIQNIILAAAGAVGTSRHRYWRLNLTQAMSHAANVALAELAFRGVIGGPNLMVPGGAWSTGGDQTPLNPGSLAIDGTNTTMWLSSAVPGWWQYDFGASPQNIVEIAISESNDANGGSYQYGPLAFNLAFSDDGIAFTALKSWTTPNWSNANTTRVFH